MAENNNQKKTIEVEVIDEKHQLYKDADNNLITVYPPNSAGLIFYSNDETTYGIKGVNNVREEQYAELTELARVVAFLVAERSDLINTAALDLYAREEEELAAKQEKSKQELSDQGQDLNLPGWAQETKGNA